MACIPILGQWVSFSLHVDIKPKIESKLSSWRLHCIVISENNWTSINLCFVSQAHRSLHLLAVVPQSRWIRFGSLSPGVSASTCLSALFCLLLSSPFSSLCLLLLQMCEQCAWGLHLVFLCSLSSLQFFTVQNRSRSTSPRPAVVWHPTWSYSSKMLNKSIYLLYSLHKT